MNTILVVGRCGRWGTSGLAVIRGIRYAKGDVHAGDLFCGLKQVLCLVIKEDVGAQNLQDWAFVDPAKEERVVHSEVPALERTNNSLVGGGISRSNYGDVDTPVVRRVLFDLEFLEILDTVDPTKELGKSAWRQRIIHVGALMRPECIEALVLHDSLRRVIGEYTVGVERNA